MNKTVSISVIIPTYKRYEKLCDCVNSLKENMLCGFTDFEVIVVDDGGNLSKKIEQQGKGLDIKWIYNSENIGQPGAQAIGVKQSKGKILAFLDDDAVVDKNWLEAIYFYFLENDDIFAVLGKIEAINTTHLLQRMRQIIYDRRDRKYSSMIFANEIKEKYKIDVKADRNLSDHVSGGNFAIRIELLEKIGGFREYIRRGNDSDLSNRILEAGYAIGYNPKMIIYHHHNKSYITLFRNNFLEGRNYVKMLRHKEIRKIRLFFEIIINILFAPFKIVFFPEMLRADKLFMKPYLIYVCVNLFDGVGRLVEFTVSLFEKKDK